MSKNYIAMLAKSALAVLCSIGIVELIGVNRYVRHIVQIHFLQLEMVLGITLWLLLYVLVLNKGANARFWPLVGAGFLAGLISGVVAAISLSILNWNRRGIFNSGLSWHDLMLFVGISMIGTCGWLVGSLSGVFLYFTVRTKT